MILARLLKLFGIKSKDKPKPNPVSGRRVKAISATILHVQETAAKLSEQKPFFKMRSGKGLYSVEKRVNRKGQLVPACFRRVDKDRRPVKVRKAARRAQRKLIKEANSNG